MLKRLTFIGALLGAFSTTAMAENGLLGPSNDPSDAPYGKNQCQIDKTTLNNVQKALDYVVDPANFADKNGGLFSPNMMWLAVVDRQGVLCLVTKSTVKDKSNTNPNKFPSDPWPGSRDIAIAKAGTANDFSNYKFALSTANLYGPTQPNGSLYGLNNSNPFNPHFNAQGTGIGFVPGGVITFGGGVALYPTAGGQVIGGLGVSGDTSCADHAIAYRVRKYLGLDKTPNVDNIAYANSGNGFTQPDCGGTGITP
jgi:uncharacterized protein GlcG (DUF336 family)